MTHIGGCDTNNINDVAGSLKICSQTIIMDNPKISVEGRKAFDGRSVNQI